jgi:hypothetical protein
MNRSLILLIVLVSHAGCDALTGEEVARLSINEVSSAANPVSKETSIDLKKGEEIAIRSDMDIEDEGDLGMRFRIQVLRDGTQTDLIEIDPTDMRITLGEFRTTVMDKTEWSFSGRNTVLEIQEDGHYTFKGMFVASENPTLKVNKAEIFFKNNFQPYQWVRNTLCFTFCHLALILRKL